MPRGNLNVPPPGNGDEGVGQGGQPLQHGVGARIMPARDGWKLDFFSVPDFEAELGTVYPALEDVVELVVKWLPRLNTEEERARVAHLEQLIKGQIQEPPPDEEP